MKKLSFSSLLLLAYFLLVSSNSYAATIDYGFKKLAPNIESDLSGQLYVSATEGTNSSNTGIFFTFHNVVGIASSITQLVMGDDDNIFSTIDLFNSSTGVEFDKSDNLNGNNYGFTKTFSQSATGTNDGVDSASEWVTLFAIYNTAENFNSLLSAISNKKLHMGLHLQSIFPTDNSDRYVLSESPILGGFGNPVPLPAALWLFGPVLLGLIGFRKKAKV